MQVADDYLSGRQPLQINTLEQKNESGFVLIGRKSNLSWILLELENCSRDKICILTQDTMTKESQPGKVYEDHRNTLLVCLPIKWVAYVIKQQ